MRLVKIVQPALIHNPNSRRNAQDGGRFLRIAKHKLGDFCVSALNDSHLPEHLEELKSKGVNFIAINGGDGTVSACMTAIAEAYHDRPLPAIAVISSGNTNLIAGDVGFGLRNEAAIDRLLKPENLLCSERSPIKISWPGTDRRPVLGMFGGCTGYARAVRIAHSPRVAKFAPHDLAVFFTLFSSLAGLLFKKSRYSWMNGDQLDWSAKNYAGQPIGHDGRSFFYMATGLERLSQGIWPFWDEGQQGSGFRFLDVHSFPKRLPSALINFLRGRVPDWLREHEDYCSDVVKQMELITDSDFVMDGEVFSASENKRLLLEEGPVFRFLHV